MEEHEWTSLGDMRGNMSFERIRIPPRTNGRIFAWRCDDAAHWAVEDHREVLSLDRDRVSDWRRRAVWRTAIPCPDAGAAAGADSDAGADIRIRRQRHLLDVSHRQGVNAERHGRTRKRRIHVRPSDQRLRELPRAWQAHVDDDAKGHIRKFAKLASAEVNQTCLTCHNRGAHAAFEGSAHERRNLSCSTCHSVHYPKSMTRQLVAATETQLCATCHRLQVAKTERAVAHMPVREGKLSCSSCHNPHGSISNVKALRVGSSWPRPASAAMRDARDRCCGSTRRCERTVRRATTRTAHRTIACWPSACRCSASAVMSRRASASVYDNNAITVNKSNRMFGRSCVNCHSNIHGSNHPSGQFLMR
jgi:predicted CXXCH cytochrome family protein